MSFASAANMNGGIQYQRIVIIIGVKLYNTLSVFYACACGSTKFLNFPENYLCSPSIPDKIIIG